MENSLKNSLEKVNAVHVLPMSVYRPIVSIVIYVSWLVKCYVTVSEFVCAYFFYVFCFIRMSIVFSFVFLISIFRSKFFEVLEAKNEFGVASIEI